MERIKSIDQNCYIYKTNFIVLCGCSRWKKT